MYLNANVSTRKTRPYQTIVKNRWAFHAEEDKPNVLDLDISKRTKLHHVDAMALQLVGNRRILGL